MRTKGTKKDKKMYMCVWENEREPSPRKSVLCVMNAGEESKNTQSFSSHWENKGP